MTDTTYQTEAGTFPVPGAVGALAVVDLPTAVSEDDVERRLLAFLERLRASARASLLERLRTDGRLALETFRDWMLRDSHHPAVRQLHSAIGKRRRRGGPSMDSDGPGDLPEDDGDPAGLLDGLDDDDDPAQLPEGDDLFARLVDYAESRPLVTSLDHIRIRRRASTYVERRNAIIDDALGSTGTDGKMFRRMKERVLWSRGILTLWGSVARAGNGAAAEVFHGRPEAFSSTGTHAVVCASSSSTRPCMPTGSRAMSVPGGSRPASCHLEVRGGRQRSPSRPRSTAKRSSP